MYMNDLVDEIKSSGYKICYRLSISEYIDELVLKNQHTNAVSLIRLRYTNSSKINTSSIIIKNFTIPSRCTINPFLHKVKHGVETYRAIISYKIRL